jgi:CRISPR-associated protein Cas1
MGHQNLGEARNLEVGLAKGGSDIGKITEEGVFHHPAMPSDDPRSVLIVSTLGSYLSLRGGHFIVKNDDQVLAKVPKNQVRSIMLFGAIQMSTQVITCCLEQDIPIALFTRGCSFLGMIHGLPCSGVSARIGQYSMCRDERKALELAAAVVRAKIHNQRTMLQRNGCASERVLSELKTLRDEALKCSSFASLLGTEGNAARLYFGAFSTMFSSAAKLAGFEFENRNRRPPKDPINALLSLGYSLLCKEITGILWTVGLDPFMGFFHTARFGRPALALDLMEEFRPLISDSIALGLVNRGALTESHFLRSTRGVFLTDEGRKIFWETWFRRLDEEVTHPQFGYKMSYRRMFEVQARLLWRVFSNQAPSYVGFTTR